MSGERLDWKRIPESVRSHDMYFLVGQSIVRIYTESRAPAKDEERRELMHAVLFSRFNRRACHCNRPYRLIKARVHPVERLTPAGPAKSRQAAVAVAMLCCP